MLVCSEGLCFSYYCTDELKGVLVEIPWGARTTSPSYFNVTVLNAANTTTLGAENKLHFAWQFENKVRIRPLSFRFVFQGKECICVVGDVQSVKCGVSV